MKKFFIHFVLLIVLTLFIQMPSFCKKAEDYYYQASLKLTSGDITEAVTFYKLATQNKKDFFEAYLGLSIAYRELKEYEKARQAISEVLKIKPDYYQVYYNLGLILENQGEYVEAIEAYDYFLQKVPGASKFTDAKQRISRIKKLI